MADLVKLRGYRRMTMQDQLEALVLAKHGTPQTEIAQKLGFTAPSISRCLKRWSSTVDLARAYLDAQALPVAKKLVKAIETPEQATDLLERQGVVGPKVDGHQGHQVQVNVGAFGGYTPPDEEPRLQARSGPAASADNGSER